MLYFILVCIAFQLWLFIRGKFSLGYGPFAGNATRVTIVLSFGLQLAIYFVLRHHYGSPYIIMLQILIFLMLPWLELKLGFVKLAPPKVKRG